MNKNAEMLLDDLKKRQDERINLYKDLCHIENINGLAPTDPFIYVNMLVSDLRNYLVNMNIIDLKIERAVCALLKEEEQTNE